MPVFIVIQTRVINKFLYRDETKYLGQSAEKSQEGRKHFGTTMWILQGLFLLPCLVQATQKTVRRITPILHTPLLSFSFCFVHPLKQLAVHFSPSLPSIPSWESQTISYESLYFSFPPRMNFRCSFSKSPSATETVQHSPSSRTLPWPSHSPVIQEKSNLCLARLILL